MDIKTYDKRPSVCNCLNTRRASQAITEIYDKYLSPCGLTIGQFSILKHISSLEPVNVSDLALSIRLDRTTLVRNLKPLEERGLVADTAAEGTRNRQLQLTSKGKEVYLLANEHWEEAQAFLKEYLGKENMDIFITLLSKIEALTP